MATITPLLAHVGGGDLPLPRWQFAYIGIAAVAATFLLLRARWSAPRLAAAATGAPFPRAADATATIAGFGLRVLGLVLWAVTIAAAWLGTDNARENLAPNLVWVMLWAGMHAVSAVLGDVWRALSPFDSIAAAAQRIRRRRAPGPAAELADDGGFATSHWIAAVAVVGFAWLELCYHAPDEPRVLAIVITAYSVVMLAGAARYGRNWLRTAEMFAVVFALFAAIAPFFRDERGRLRVRAPFAGLSTVKARSGTVLVVTALIGATVFDGVASTSWWAGIVDGRVGWGRTLVNSVGLAATVAVVVAGYLAATRERPRRYVAALVPIALGYGIAHYFSLFVVEAQTTLPLISDPFGEGEDFFGFGSPNPDLEIVSPTATVWIQAVAIIAGHLAGLVVAYDRAREVDDASDEGDGSITSLYPLLFFVLASTTAGLALMLG